MGLHKTFCLLLAVVLVRAVDRSKFRTCTQTKFCETGRAQTEVEYKDYFVSDTFKQKEHLVSARLAPTKNAEGESPLLLIFEFLVNNVIRMRIKEEAPLHPRWEVPDVLLEEGLKSSVPTKVDITGEGFSAEFGGTKKLVVTSNPFLVELWVQGEVSVVANADKLLNFWPYRPKDKDPYQNGEWEEKFSSHNDPRSRGPASVALDVTFVGSQHVYGIPEHASSFALKNTKDKTDPYRLWNLDVFEYELDETMALYGAVPFMVSHDTSKTTAVLWLNSAETWIDTSDSEYSGRKSKKAHWISESGIIDLFFFAGPTPKDVFFQYGSLTGFQELPPKFATAYHQCRWNYRSEKDVAEVDAGFDEHDIPYDTLWLDIEHTNGKRYFTWDKTWFPTPKEMQEKIGAKKRKMVTIIDPHIKHDNNYYVHKEAKAGGHYVKKSDGSDYDGWCWPGTSGYLDFCKPEVRQFWASLFGFDKYEGSTPHLFTWNDMNEPSVFNGPEVTMPKHNLHLDGKFEHRDVHNMYGFYHQMSTVEGQLHRSPEERPFVLTRSFFSGSQRYGAVWTGDNEAKWSHLEAATPMLLSLGVAGIQFSGADVGGFFGDPDTELLVRWYQSGIYQPFFRAHAHTDAKRREPWLFGEPYTSRIRAAVRTRYAYLPYIYSTFREASVTGIPIMRPLWVEFPREENVFATEDMFLLGAGLLVKPVVKAGVTSINVALPARDMVWYNTKTYTAYLGGQTISADAPPDYIPVFQRGGTIIPKRERSRRNSAVMVNDPYTLVVALTSKGFAEGSLYLDDGSSFAYRKEKKWTLRNFKFEDGLFTSTNSGPAGYETACTVERIIVWGYKRLVKTILMNVVGEERELTFKQTFNPNVLVIRKPNFPVTGDTTITIKRS